MTDEKHYFANDGSDWTTPPSPVDANEAREADRAYDDEAAKGDGPGATNETSLHRTVVEDSGSKNAAAEEDADTAEGEGANGA